MASFDETVSGHGSPNHMLVNSFQSETRLVVSGMDSDISDLDHPKMRAVHNHQDQPPAGAKSALPQLYSGGVQVDTSSSSVMSATVAGCGVVNESQSAQPPRPTTANAKIAVTQRV